ncbi:type I restriction endonuclease subunit R [Helicobacter cetorum]|uniref:type I restriction endonuclease subunit R n=1 Tax=Helicobacter cetorum TaxID=138563 RepID=UPI000CF03F06|nr:type I restriction endonuclease subunit R [Helicobacter cetorum]
MSKTNQQKVILESPLTCVSAFVEHEPRARKSDKQSEGELEETLIKDLESLGYEKIKPKNEQELKQNFKNQFERLNNITLSENEFKRLLNDELNGEGYTDRTRRAQRDWCFNFEFDNKETKTLQLFDKSDLSKNHLQVMNQYKSKDNRYDVQILVNGLPLVHIELKKRGVSINEAIEQLERYKEEGLRGNLLEFIQMFIASNGTLSYYYPNSAFFKKLLQKNETKNQKKAFKSESVFKIHWANKDNKAWLDLEDFTPTFLNKDTLLKILFFYSVFNANDELLIMRPYQVKACEEILQKIYRNLESKEKCKSRGYIWHSTGSGKTLTSFKTAILLKSFERIEKILFVVDRKDLDHQTIQEYNKFQKGCVTSTNNGADLKEKLKSSKEQDKIIITTIQKLNRMIDKDKKGKDTESYYQKEVVFIFDECHRSQFGTMHQNITENFKNYHLYGFTGTPILSQEEKNRLLDNPNAKENKSIELSTDYVFGECLHQYTIVHAIENETVLKFMVDYYKDNDKLDKLESLNPKRIDTIAKEIIHQFNTKTKQREFNSILATESISMARKYYESFQSISHDLKIALIYSSASKSDEEEENNEDAKGLDPDDKEFLSRAINHYNEKFHTNFRINRDFEGYYKDISSRMKKKEIDLLIVVNMFLTGFDAPSLNTLWVDKNLKEHGLIQAFSRTNRIYNPQKSHGNIVSFRNLENNLNDALKLYSLDNHKEVVISHYNEGLEKYQNCVEKFQKEFELNFLKGLETIEQKKAFMRAFNELLRLDNALRYFSQFEKDRIIDERALQDYGSYYQDFKDDLKSQANGSDNRDNADNSASKNSSETTNSNDIDEQDYALELLKVIEVSVKYILELFQKGVPAQEINEQVNKAPSAREIKGLLEEFFKRFEKEKPSDIIMAFEEFIQHKKEKELEEIIKRYHLKSDETKDFINKAFNNRSISFLGAKFGKIFNADFFDADYASTKKAVKEALQAYFDFYNKDFLK